MLMSNEQRTAESWQVAPKFDPLPSLPPAFDIAMSYNYTEIRASLCVFQSRPCADFCTHLFTTSASASVYPSSAGLRRADRRELN